MGDRGGNREEGIPEGFQIQEYLYLKTYDKQVDGSSDCKCKFDG